MLLVCCYATNNAITLLGHVSKDRGNIFDFWQRTDTLGPACLLQTVTQLPPTIETGSPPFFNATPQMS